MFYRIFSAKDTFITNERLSGGTPLTASNCGASEILHVHKYMESSGTGSFAHILTQFDISELADVTGSSTPIEYWLKLTNAQHDQTLPYSYDLEIQTLSQPWDEGRGQDVDSFSDKGFANWVKAKSNLYWTSPGAVCTGSIVTAYFDDGHENLEVNITPIVHEWLSGSITNNGLLIKLSSSLESDNSDYYIKMFHSRTTHFKDKRPYIEARWDDSVKDDRNNFVFGVSGTLALNHVVRGQLENISAVGTGSIAVIVNDASGTLGIFTGSYVSTGRYNVTFALPSSSYSGSLFHDVWVSITNNSTLYMSSSFSIAGNLNFTDTHTKKYFVNISNLKDEYNLDERVRLDTYIRPFDYNPARVLTASLDDNGTVITKGYYKIVNDRTDEVVVPFGTGSLEYTRMSYDQKGNYFNVVMKSLSPGNLYRILFLLDIDGQRQYIDRGFKFRVR